MGVAACLLASSVVPVSPALAVENGSTGMAVSVRSFPKQSDVRPSRFRESVGTEVQSDVDWGGIESLNVPKTKSQAERDAEAKAKRDAERRQAAQAQAQEQAQAGQQVSRQASGASRDAARTDIEPPASRTGRAVAEYAMRFGGYPYVYGGNQPSGWDCSGFVQYVFSRFGVSLPHSSGAQMSVGSPVASLADAQPGDVLANASHAAIYVGNGMVMNAMSPAQGTGLAPVGMVMYGGYSIRRVV